MIPLNFHHLYYFYAVARNGSVSKAAQELRLSQPALSAQLKQLESHLDLKLFERRKRRLILTAEGRSALSYAKTIFDTGQEFIDGVRDRSQAGRIRIQIGVTNSIGKTFANDLVRRVLAASPQAHVVLREDTLENMAAELNDHLLDLLLSDMPYQASAEEKIANKLVGRIPVTFCAHPRLARYLERFPRNLGNAPFILPTSHSGIYSAVQDFFSAHRVVPRIIAEIQDTELIHRMALDGAGIAPLNLAAAKNPAFRRKLVTPARPPADIYESIYLIAKERKTPHPLAAKILEDFHIRA